jgi:type IV fimbrial biogenesis protein FimT
MVSAARTDAGRAAMRGFTIIELMVVVVIVAILTAFAAPSMGKMIRNQRVKTAAFDVFASITLARSEALKRNLSVTITPNNSADWTKGWAITDSNGNVIKLEKDRQLTASEMVMTGPVTLVYARTGRLSSASVPLNPKFNISTSGTNTLVRCVKVDLSGRPLSTEAACT